MARYFCGRCRATCDERLSVCPACGEWSNYVVDVALAAREPSPALVQTARQLAAHMPRTSEVWSLGRIALRPPLLIAAWGEPGGGKSSWALKVSSEMAQQGHRVLIVNSEEGLGDTMSARLRRLEIHEESILVTGNINFPSARSIAEEHDCSVIVLDSWSVSSWTAIDVDHARADFVTVVVLHATKGGEAAGPAAIPHAADIVLEVHDGKAKLTKSRWSGLIETEVFSE